MYSFLRSVEVRLQKKPSKLLPHDYLGYLSINAQLESYDALDIGKYIGNIIRGNEMVNTLLVNRCAVFWGMV
jgi:hypothetical protein